VQTAGGFNAPNSQSQREASLAGRAFGRDAGDVVVLYSGPTLTAASPAFRSAVTGTRATPSSNWRAPSDTARQDSYDTIKTQLSAPGLRSCTKTRCACVTPRRLLQEMMR
jgi:hypothetical protein